MNFIEKMYDKIDDMLQSSCNAKQERQLMYEKFGIPVNSEDGVLMYYDGEINALMSIRNYIDSLVKGDGQQL